MRQIAKMNKASPRGARVVVTGGTGYIGSILVRLLLKGGAQVTVIDSLLYGQGSIEPLLDTGLVQIIRADVRSDFDIMVSACRGAVAVVHLAAIVGDPACSLDEHLAWTTNYWGTRAVHEVAVHASVPVAILASTCSVYGAQEHLLTEDSPVKPLSVYSESKVAAERVFSLPGSGHTKCVTLRFGTLFGTSARHRFDLVVNRLTAMAVRDDRITVFGPQQWRPFVHVKDAARAIVSVIESRFGLSQRTLFNIVGPTPNWTLSAMAELIQTEIPSAQLIYSDKGVDIRNYCVSDNRVQCEIGFRPTHQLHHGITEVATAVRGGGLNYMNPRFSNVESLAMKSGIY
jgi:nucleoside-diphosphate-sugar epimerase